MEGRGFACGKCRCGKAASRVLQLAYFYFGKQDIAYLKTPDYGKNNFL
jgi:hypothetical protein